MVSACAQPVHRCSFGDDRFLKLVEGGRFDLLCHHAAETADYRSPDFDPVAAVGRNTWRLRTVLDGFANTGGRSVVLTGSFFESDEGEPRGEAFSPYGLSKALTYQTFRYYCAAAGVPLAKFVIPNPFGPLEDPRFTTHLVGAWFEGSTPQVRTPGYIRDNIHVSLLARAYAAFAARAAEDGDTRKVNPSGYRMSQGDFAAMFAREMGNRIMLPCPLDVLEQTDFREPLERVNTDVLDAVALGWSESVAWDELAEYYLTAVGDIRATRTA
jgi:nucleoside-diphosphate-sugar epimerase